MIAYLLVVASAASCLNTRVHESRGERLDQEIKLFIKISQSEFERATGKKVKPPPSKYLSIEFHHEAPDCPASSQSKKCLGVIYIGKITTRILVKSDRCIPKTSLAHELMHYWMYKTYGNIDANHDDKRIFRRKTSATHRANAIGIARGLCD